MRNVLRRAAGPGIVALVGLGFDAADFFGSNALAYSAWAAAGLWAVYLAWPLLKRWRPFTLAPPEGNSDVSGGHVFTPTVSQVPSSEVMQRLKAENEQLKERLRDVGRESAALRADQRRKRIGEWRSVIQNFDFDTGNFARTDTYNQMKADLRPEVTTILEPPNKVHALVGEQIEMQQNLRRTLLSEVARIEREWGLI